MTTARPRPGCPADAAARLFAERGYEQVAVPNFPGKSIARLSPAEHSARMPWNCFGERVTHGYDGGGRYDSAGHRF